MSLLTARAVRERAHEMLALGEAGALRHWRVDRTKLDRVEITSLHEGTFYAEIELDRDGAKSRISSRPSDAIALAVRFGADIPIFADEEVLDEAGVLFEADDEEQEVAQFRQFLDEITPEDFAQ